MSKLLETFLVKHPEEVAHLLENVPLDVFQKKFITTYLILKRLFLIFHFHF